MKKGDSRLLKHPLVLELVNQKWEAYGSFLYLADFFCYVAFVALLNCYGMLLPKPNMFKSTKVTLPDDIVVDCSVLRPDVPFNAFEQYSSYHPYVNKVPLTLKDGNVTQCSIACAAPWSSYAGLQISLFIWKVA